MSVGHDVAELGGNGRDTSRGAGRRIALASGIATLAAAVAFAGFATFGGGGGGPVDTTEDFFAALGLEDLVGTGESLLPGERRILFDPLTAYIEEAKRLGVVSDTDGKSLAGLDLRFADVTFEAEPLAEDLVWVAISGSVASGLRAEELPFGSLVVRYLPESWAEDLPDTVEEDVSFGDAFGLALVKEDGRWYVSLLHTIAESARREAGAAFPATLPLGEPSGAPTPEEALQHAVLAFTRLDLRGLVDVLDPDETAAFRRYAGLFMDDWDAAIAEVDEALIEAGVSYSVDEVVTRSTPQDGTTVGWIEDVPRFSLTIDAPDVGNVLSIDKDGDCLRIEVDKSLLEALDQTGPIPGVDLSEFTGEECVSADAFGGGPTVGAVETDPTADSGDLFFDLPAIGPLLKRWSEGLENLGETGASAVQFELVERDGRWYVGLARTLHRWTLALTGTLDESLLTEVGDDIKQASEDPAALEERIASILTEFGQEGLLDPFGAAPAGQPFPAVDTSELGLDAFAEQCMAGNGVSCDVLFLLSPRGSAEEQIGSECAGRGVGNTVSCSGYDPGTSVANGYGDDPLLDALYDLCEDSISAACAALFDISPIGSEYEAFSQSLP